MDYLKRYEKKSDPPDDFHCVIGDCTFVGESGPILLKHYRRYHPKGLFKSHCLYSKSCFHEREFTSYRGLRSHLERYHPVFFKEEANSCQSPSNQLSDSATEQGTGFDPQDVPTTTNGGVSPSRPLCLWDQEAPPTSDIQDMGAQFVMDLLADRTQTQIDVQAIIKGTTHLMKQAVHNTLERAASLIAEGSDPSECFELLLEENSSSDPFLGLHNQHSQIQYFKNRYGLVMPVKVHLPSTVQDFGRVRTGHGPEIRRQDYTYVPLLTQLEQLLNMQDVYEEVNRSKVSIPGVYARYEDGHNFKNNELFQRHPNGLQIHLYLDEVQSCNPLGSYNHKIVYVYFTLGNLCAKNRSKFKSINLLALFYYDQVSMFDINLLLEPIFLDIKKLEDGVPFDIGGKIETFYGTLTAIPADNLASHMVGGFKLGFSRGFRKCRTCLGRDCEIQEHFTDFQFKHRTVEDHDSFCSSMEVDDLKSHFSYVYGLNHNSIFNRLTYFHVIDGGLPPDLMHDLLEGVIPLVICKVLQYFLKNKYFTLDSLNYVIQNFDYGPAEVTDKPSLISNVHIKNMNLKQSASQRWLLFNLLPLMIGAKIPSCKPWDCYIILLRVCRLVFQDSFTSLEIFRLGDSISAFLTSYKCAFKARIIPKMHHMVHYPRYIRLLGPLSSFWCMRYEGKHAYFKNVIRIVGNYTNLPWTLGYRHQQWMCKQMSQCINGEFLKDVITVPKKKAFTSFSLQLSPYGGQVAQYFCLDYPFPIVKQSPWLKINSILFKVNSSVLLCSLNGARASQFGLLVKILTFNGRTLFVCRMLTTKYFSSRFQAYKVAFRNFFLVVDPKNIVHFQVYSLHVPSFMRSDNVNYYVVTRTNKQQNLLGQ